MACGCWAILSSSLAFSGSFLRSELAVSIDSDSGSTHSFMPLNGLPSALGGFGASVMGSSAGLAATGADDELESELGVLASGWAPPQAASERSAMDEQRLNRENKLIAISWVIRGVRNLEPVS